MLRSFGLSTILVTLILTLAPSATRAQAFPEGTHAISAGIGGLTLIGEVSRTFDSYTGLNYSGMGPVYFKYEYGVSENIGLGVNVAYTENVWSYNVFDYDINGTEIQYAVEQKRQAYSVLARVNFHMGSNERFDPYIGLGLGFRDASWQTDTNAPYELYSINFPTFVRLGSEFTIGMRYFFTNNIGLYAEVGAAKSIFQGGLSLRF